MDAKRDKYQEPMQGLSWDEAGTKPIEFWSDINRGQYFYHFDLYMGRILYKKGALLDTSIQYIKISGVWIAYDLLMSIKRGIPLE